MEWQPIETYEPGDYDDEESVIVYDPSIEYVGEGIFYPHAFEKAGSWMSPDDLDLDNVTHWMPLPKPPAA